VDAESLTVIEINSPPHCRVLYMRNGKRILISALVALGIVAMAFVALVVAANIGIDTSLP